MPSKKAKNIEKKETSKSNAKPVKLSNGFTVESCNVVKPSTTNETIPNEQKPKKKRRKNKKNKKKTVETTEEKPKILKNKPQVKNNNNNKKSKPKLGENMSDTVSDLTPEDMLTWAEFKLPEPILKALAEQGFKKPTKIQELTLPAAIHGKYIGFIHKHKISKTKIIHQSVRDQLPTGGSHKNTYLFCVWF